MGILQIDRISDSETKRHGMSSQNHIQEECGVPCIGKNHHCCFPLSYSPLFLSSGVKSIEEFLRAYCIGQPSSIYAETILPKENIVWPVTDLGDAEAWDSIAEARKRGGHFIILVIRLS